MKIVCIVLLSLCFALLANGATYTWSGTVTVDQPIAFNATDVLIIQPGTTVYFLRSTSLITIAGLVSANGTSASPIKFTRDPSLSGLYRGIGINSNTVKDVFFSFCEFSYASFGLFVNTYQSQMRLGASIKNCTFQNNDVGVSVASSVATMSGCLFQNNNQAGVKIDSDSKFHLNDSRIINNVDGGVFIGSATIALIVNCLISGNGGVGVSTNKELTMYNNTITNNAKGGISTFSPTVTIQYNNIYSNALFQYKLRSGSAGTVYNLQYNYWGTTNKTLLAEWMPSTMVNVNLPDIKYSPVFSQLVETCSSCLVDVTLAPPPGYIGSNTTWTLANSPYSFAYDVFVPKGTWLTIEAGVVVKFSPGKQFTVEGGIVTQGTSAQPITFTADTTGNSSATWLKAEIRSTYPFQLSYVNFDKLDTGVYLAAPTYYTPVQIIGCTFRNSNNGIVIAGPMLLNITGCAFELNKVGIFVGGNGGSGKTNIMSSTIADNQYGVQWASSTVFFNIYDSTITRSSISAFFVDSVNPIGQGSLKLFFSKIFRNRLAFTRFGPVFEMSYCDFYDNYNPPSRTSPFLSMSTYFNGSFVFRQNYYGELDECFYSQALLPMKYDFGKLVIINITGFTSSLTSSYETACTKLNMESASCVSATIVPQTGLRYDKCGVCGGDNSTCVNNCADNPVSPYTCSDKSCIDIPLFCPTSDCGGRKKCWNGACVDNSATCPPFPRCSSAYPKRCSDGTCVLATATCPVPFGCLSPLQSCPDGSCATDCLPYNGCLAGYTMCPDGSCTNTACATGSCPAGQSLCADSSCAASCPKPAWFPQIDSFIFANTGSMNLSDGSSISIINYKMGTTTMQPRADSLMRAVTSPWVGMGFEQGVRSPVMLLTSRAPDVLIKITFTLPTLSPAFNYCLGYVNETTNTWQCDGALDKQSDNVTYVSSIIKFGTYAIILDNGNMGTARNNTGIFPTPAPTPKPTLPPTSKPTPSPAPATTSPTGSPTGNPTGSSTSPTGSPTGSRTTTTGSKTSTSTGSASSSPTSSSPTSSSSSSGTSSGSSNSGASSSPQESSASFIFGSVVLLFLSVFFSL